MPDNRTMRGVSDFTDRTVSEAADHLMNLKRLTRRLEIEKKKLGDVREFWQERRRALEEEVVQERWNILQKENEIKELSDVKEPWPGPHSLLFVERTWFIFLAALVVMANIGTMMVGTIHAEYKPKLFWLDQVFLVFYIFELSIKAMLMQRRFLFGPVSVVWWNWLDLIIVVIGIFDQWVISSLMYFGVMGTMSGGGALNFIRVLRLLRLLRILKIVKSYLEIDLSWAEGDRFQFFVMVVIFFNSVIMSLEADLTNWAWLWYWIEQTLLCIFFFELLVRLRFHGLKFFYNRPKGELFWNWLDFVIVVGGIVDQWLLPLISVVRQAMGEEGSSKSQAGQLMTLLRMARLLRILRLARLIRSIPPLYELMIGIASSLRSMMWVLVLTFVLLYIVALFCVKLIGQGLLWGGHAPEKAAAVFPTVSTSLWSLFMVMNADTGTISDLLEVVPLSKSFFALYMVASNWAILAILTAVVSDNMIAATSAHREGEEVAEARATASSKEQYLGDVFDAAKGEREENLLLEDEFLRLCEDADHMEELQQTFEVTHREVSQMFRLMSRTHMLFSGEEVVAMDKSTFIEGFMTQRREVTERSILRLEKKISSMEVLVKEVDKEVKTKPVELEEKLRALIAELDSRRNQPVASAERRSQRL